MKRSELKVGAELFWSRSKDWQYPQYGSGEGARVIVTATEPYSDRRYGRREKPHPVDGGSGVLVAVYYEHETTGHPQVVPLAQLKGPYAETAARVAAWCVERDAENRVKNEAYNARVSRAVALVKRAADLGCHAERHHCMGALGIQLSLDEFEALLIRMEAAQ